MTDAIITDLAQFRARKQGPTGTPLRSWSDAKLQSRYKVLWYIEQGFVALKTGPLAAIQWPDGFDPENHPGENIELVRAEAETRGVTLT
jgi:hypothetical protein